MGLFRVLLALSVVFAHIAHPNWYTGFGGDIAVEAFFLISGFYMARILSVTYKNSRGFYMNRALRIFPIYYLVLLVTILQLLMFKQANIGDDFSWPNNFSEYAAFLTNFTLFGSDWMQFLNIANWGFSFSGRSNVGTAANFLLIAPAWTLGVELTFYILAPRVTTLSIKALSLSVAFLFSVRTIFWFLGFGNDPWSYRFLLFEIPVFFLGIVIYKVQQEYFSRYRMSIKSSYLLGLGMYVLIGIAGSQLKLDRIWILVVTLVASTCLLLLSGDSRLDTRIGELSYPIYLCHSLVVSSLAVGFEKFGLFEKQYGRSIFEISVVGLVFLTSKVLLSATAPLENLRTRIRSNQY